MNSIEESIAAMRSCKPESNVFLRVVGNGSNQCLEAKKINWFGRLLMWLGCSSACMTKVAKFVEQNIDAFCRSKAITLTDDANPLGKCIDKIESYDSKHPRKISHLASKISAVYVQYRYAALSVEPIAIQTPPPPSPKVQVGFTPITQISQDIPVPALPPPLLVLV